MRSPNILLWSTFPPQQLSILLPPNLPRFAQSETLSAETKHRPSPQILGNTCISPPSCGSTPFLNMFYYSTELCQSNNIPACFHGHSDSQVAVSYSSLTSYFPKQKCHSLDVWVKARRESKRVRSILYLLITYFTFPSPPNIAPTSLTHSAF